MRTHTSEEQEKSAIPPSSCRNTADAVQRYYKKYTNKTTISIENLFSMISKIEQVERKREELGCFVLLSNVELEGKIAKIGEELFRAYKE